MESLGISNTSRGKTDTVSFQIYLRLEPIIPYLGKLDKNENRIQNPYLQIVSFIETLKMEDFKTYNNCNSTSFGNLMASFLFVWIFNAFGVYLIMFIIKYLREKPPNLQTLLDGFYIQLFANGIIFRILAMITEGLLYLHTLGIENHIMANATAWLCYSSVLLNSVFFATSCVARAILIFWPSCVEKIDDRKVWILNG